MARKKTPPWKGLSPGPIIVACQWNRSSPIGPAEHDDGGSLQCICQPSSFPLCLHLIDMKQIVPLLDTIPDSCSWGGKWTYRPRSVSSLLIRFNAIVWSEVCIRMPKGDFVAARDERGAAGYHCLLAMTGENVAIGMLTYRRRQVYGVVRVKCNR
jgi:hypothetical protein